MLLEAQGDTLGLIMTSSRGIKFVRILLSTSVRCSTCKLGTVLRKFSSVTQS